MKWTITRLSEVKHAARSSHSQWASTQHAHFTQMKPFFSGPGKYYNGSWPPPAAEAINTCAMGPSGRVGRQTTRGLRFLQGTAGERVDSCDTTKT